MPEDFKGELMASRKPIQIRLVGIGRAGWSMHRKELAGREKTFQIAGAYDPVKARREMI